MTKEDHNWKYITVTKIAWMGCFYTTVALLISIHICI